MQYTINEEKLNSILSSLLIEFKTQKEIWNGINVYLAKSFNLIKLLNPTNEENKFSDIIKLLLDPNGEHAQGDIFLKLFFKTVLKLRNNQIDNFPLDHLSLKEAKILREKSMETKRVDLLIDSKNKNLPVIALENKIWAPETKEQLKKYFEYLKSKYKNFILIFLTPYGRQAKTAPETKEQLKKYFECSYKDLLKPWLKECLKECKAEKVRFFIQDFIDWIDSFY